MGEAGAVSSRTLYNAAHLDFCNGLTLDNIRTAANVAKNVSVMPAVLSVTMMKGRETTGKGRPNMDICPAMNRAQRRAWMSDIKKGRETWGSVGE